MTSLFLRYFYLQQQWQHQQQAELRSRLQALQSRIRPHFLFNSLNSIASLIEIAPSKAEQAVLDLSDLFRANLSGSETLSCWGRSAACARAICALSNIGWVSACACNGMWASCPIRCRYRC
ncbi:histidine kinase [Halopseudomonas pachastrellae]|nr:histidine kinase [Halopseudomonas pachastrellae]